MPNQGPRGSAGPENREKIFTSCPHCGRELSPWERVLLGVDRALMCKHCWYRIILDVRADEPPNEPAPPSKEPK